MRTQTFSISPVHITGQLSNSYSCYVHHPSSVCVAGRPQVFKWVPVCAQVSSAARGPQNHRPHGWFDEEEQHRARGAWLEVRPQAAGLRLESTTWTCDRHRGQAQLGIPPWTYDRHTGQQAQSHGVRGGDRHGARPRAYSARGGATTRTPPHDPHVHVD